MSSINALPASVGAELSTVRSAPTAEPATRTEPGGGPIAGPGAAALTLLQRSFTAVAPATGRDLDVLA